MEFTEHLIAASEDDLYQEIGRAFRPKERYALPEPVRVLVEVGKKWFDSNAAKLRHIICSNKKVQRLAEDGFSVELAAAVGALLESFLLGTAATPVAVLISKYKLKKLCQKVWDDES